jgi:mono/diheme cytochrome c family protein
MQGMKPCIRTFFTAAALAAATGAIAATPTELLDGWRQAAGRAAVPAQGQALFTRKHGREWSCASCHGTVPTQPGRHASTGKPIQPLAPAFDGTRFTEAAKAEKWFRRNCQDVLDRDCTAGEKADVLAWLLTLKP